MPSRLLIILVTVTLGTLPFGCFPKRYDPARGTVPYPRELGRGETVAVQVTRDGDTMHIVNGTAIGFRDFDLWLNQRYLHHVESLPPGGRISIGMNEFWDMWGGGPNPGGLLRWYDPTPIVLVEAQIDEESPLIGFISILESDELER